MIFNRLKLAVDRVIAARFLSPSYLLWLYA